MVGFQVVIDTSSDSRIVDNEKSGRNETESIRIQYYSLNIAITTCWFALDFEAHLGYFSGE